MKRAIALILIVCSNSLAQYTFEVRFVANPERTAYIGVFHRNGMFFGSLSDIAAAFNLAMAATPQSAIIRTDKLAIALTLASPYTVVTDRNNNANVWQLSAEPLRAANTLFVPLESFIPILDAVLDEEIVFNKSLQLIAVGDLHPGPKFDLASLSIEERDNGSLVRLHLAKPITDYESWLKPIDAPGKGTQENYWLYVTLVGTTVDTAALEAVKLKGLIKQLLVFQSPTSAQLTFRLKGEITGTEMLPADEGNDLLLTIHTPTPEEIALRKKEENEKNLARERTKWKMDVIVVDAGHGGRDPGAIGVTRVKEKDVTLGVALKLGRLIQKNMKGVKVVYTRTDDEFVELYRRGQIANQSEGKLFISIHCNSMPRKPNPANGFEIYLLRPGKTEHAIEISQRENAVIEFEEGYKERYQELTEENFIILTMAQTAYMKYSEQFADMLQQEMEASSGMENGGVKQAGFYVLVGASMPNVLVETGYLSNRKDERFLKSQNGQQKIAEAIFNGVKLYKQEYEKALEEGRMMGTKGE